VGEPGRVLQVTVSLTAAPLIGPPPRPAGGDGAPPSNQ